MGRILGRTRPRRQIQRLEVVFVSGNNGEEAPGRADRYWVEALEETGQNNRREEREEGEGRKGKKGEGRKGKKEGREEGRREEGWKGRRMEGKKDGRDTEKGMG